MQKWEYLYVEYSYSYYVFNEVKHKYESKVYGKARKFPIREKLGLEGWELTIAYSADSDHEIYKRPIE
jgi:hypothetical protein